MPRKGENIYKRKDGRWEARYIYAFKEDGSPRYRSIYAADYLTVKKKQNDAKRKMDPRLFQSVRMKKNISFYGLLWLERLKPSSKESTYVRYHYLFSHYISPMIGDRLVYTFSNKDCEVFLNRLLVSGKRDGSGLAPKTVTDIRSVVKLILKTAEKEYSYFSVVPSQMNDIERFLEKHTTKTKKYVIDKKIKWRVRDMLDQMNINERIAYPGLDGLTLWLKRHYYVK